MSDVKWKLPKEIELGSNFTEFLKSKFGGDAGVSKFNERWAKVVEQEFAYLSKPYQVQSSTLNTYIKENPTHKVKLPKVNIKISGWEISGSDYELDQLVNSLGNALWQSLGRAVGDESLVTVEHWMDVKTEGEAQVDKGA